jgi:hypothetical protein
MENMLKYDFMKYRHHLLYYRVPPIYIRYMYIPQKRKQKLQIWSLYHSRDRIVAASRPLHIYTECESCRSSFWLWCNSIIKQTMPIFHKIRFKHIFHKRKRLYMLPKVKCICMIKRKFCVANFWFLTIVILFVFEI